MKKPCETCGDYKENCVDTCEAYKKWREWAIRTLKMVPPFSFDESSPVQP